MGEIVLRNGQISMEMDISNKAMSPMSGFGIQFNKNSFGLGALFIYFLKGDASQRCKKSPKSPTRFSQNSPLPHLIVEFHIVYYIFLIRV